MKQKRPALLRLCQNSWSVISTLLENLEVKGEASFICPKQFIFFFFFNFNYDLWRLFKKLFSCILFFNRCLKSYQPLKEDPDASEDSQVSRSQGCPGASKLWSSLNRQGAMDNCPLLQDRLL